MYTRGHSRGLQAAPLFFCHSFSFIRSHRSALLTGVATAALGLAALPASAANVTVVNGATYDLNVDPTTVDSLTINAGGTVNLRNKILVVNDNGINTVWSGLITGVVDVGTLDKRGNGTVTFSNLTSTDSEIHINGGTAVQSGTTNNIRVLAVGGDTGGSGVFNITGGQLNIAIGGAPSPFPAFQVGAFGSTGVVNQSGGAVTLTTAAFNIGSQGGTGTYNLTGGTVTMQGGSSSTISIGRNTAPTRVSTGVLNISGGLFDVEAGELVNGNAYSGAEATATSGTINQSGGILRIGAAAKFDIAGYNKGTYNLTGGTLEIGGSSLRTNYLSSTGVATFNLAAARSKSSDLP